MKTTITGRHITLIIGIAVAFIVLFLMVLRSPDANLAAAEVFPPLEGQGRLSMPEIQLVFKNAIASFVNAFIR